MKEVRLVNCNLFMKIDDEDYEKVIIYKWYPLYKKDRIYARANASRKNNGKPTSIFVHQIVLGINDKIIDHKNRDGLDNRRENLRVANNSLSKYKGISKHNNNWRARITVNGKTISIGTFITQEEAALAYDNAARIYFKDFARTNFGEQS